MKQGLVRLLYNLGKVHGVDITHDNVCSSMLSCFYSHLLSTGRPISSFVSKFQELQTLKTKLEKENPISPNLRVMTMQKKALFLNWIN